MKNRYILIVMIFIVAFIVTAGCTNSTQISIDKKTFHMVGNSMSPNINDGDYFSTVSLDNASVQTYQDSQKTGYRSFGDYGDVIAFNAPSGYVIAHRAMYWVEQGQPMWSDGPAAPYSGYITKGDNLEVYDQQGANCKEQPVKTEWIVGIARPL